MAVLGLSRLCSGSLYIYIFFVSLFILNNQSTLVIIIISVCISVFNTIYVSKTYYCLKSNFVQFL